MKLPKGFRYSAVFAGLRKVIKDDVTLIVSDVPANAAAVFTQNQAAAAPVKLAQKHLRITHGKAQAFLVNAGNANCATQTGAAVAETTVAACADALGIRREFVLPASTGVIGVEMNPELIVNVLPKLAESLSSGGFNTAASAIMTTDLVPKAAFATAGGAVIAGMTKGSGMIQPLMATTLGFVVTDAAVSLPVLRKALKHAVAHSYNRMSVDGDTSTNDMVAVLANGTSGKSPSAESFTKALTQVLESLAKQIARDGEGARKLITIDVTGASSDQSAELIARFIANSPLVKTAVGGSDPNWGRVMMAAGNAGVRFDPLKVDIEMQGMKVCRGGLAAPFSEDDLKERLNKPDVSIRFHLRGAAKGKARFWTCDLTEGYIEINGKYRT